MRIAAGILIALGVLLSAGCSDIDRVTTIDVDPPPVGELVVGWSQADIPVVADFVEQGFGASGSRDLLLRTDAEWAAWIATLPPELAVAAGTDLDLDLHDAVVVVGTYPACMERSRIANWRDGVIAFQVYVPHEHKGTMCSWSPQQIDVWLVKLEELGLSSADDVVLEH